MMRHSLESLAKLEASIQSHIRSVSGTMDEKFAELRSAGVFRQYCEVFEALVHLASESETKLEALKRATFLAWYELAEPACFSGVADLPSDSLSTVTDLIEPLVPSLDAEFRWMLTHYFSIADYAFPDLGSRPNLCTLLATEESDVWRTKSIEADKMHGRGLMGDYWRSILEAGRE